MECCGISEIKVTHKFQSLVVASPKSCPGNKKWSVKQKVLGREGLQDLRRQLRMVTDTECEDRIKTFRQQDEVSGD